MAKVNLLKPLIAGIVTVYIVASFLFPSTMVLDSQNGFRVWESMQNGAPFNCLALPDGSYRFETWWSPGQYLIPGALSLLGLLLPKAIWLTVALFSVSGLLGCYYLYQALGFSENQVLTSCLVLVLTRGFSIPFDTYNGGEVLSFGVAPWIILFALRYKKLSIWACIGLFLLFLTGTFLKLSFVITSLAILASLFLLQLQEKGFSKELAATALKCGAVFLAFYSILYAAFLSKGNTPGNATTAQLSVFPSLYSLTAPYLNAFAAGDILNRVFLHPRAPLVSGIAALWPLFLALAGGCTALTVWLFKRSNPSYQAVFAAFSSVYFVAMTGLYLAGATISYEDRHFRPAALVFLPGIVAVAGQVRSRLLRNTAIAVMVFCLAYSATWSVTRTVHNRRAVIMGTVPRKSGLQ